LRASSGNKIQQYKMGSLGRLPIFFAAVHDCRRATAV